MTTILSILNSGINYNYVSNTTISTVLTFIRDQFRLNASFFDDKIREQDEYTDQESEAWRV